ncbi:4Fe-4S binding protein [Ferroglobus placidus]|uniref:4Fe-4S binding protein n=1 Tax=Ferroglobus placidus TaxID=54261 RepID=UPI00145D64C2|nr:4Fe-4S binding protein [Ferroglobus placidus]
MEGFEVEFCRACRNALSSLEHLKEGIAEILKGKIWKAKKSHEKIKIGISACPNACSSPQIKDFGVIAFIKPQVDLEKCNSCKACFRACRENAIDFNGYPSFHEKCIGCGDCMRACKTGAIKGETYFKVLAGGRLGRHPRFAEIVAIVKDENVVLRIFGEVLRISYERNERFSYIDDSIEILKKRITNLAFSQVNNRLDC